MKMPHAFGNSPMAENSRIIRENVCFAAEGRKNPRKWGFGGRETAFSRRKMEIVKLQRDPRMPTSSQDYIRSNSVLCGVPKDVPSGPKRHGEKTCEEMFSVSELSTCLSGVVGGLRD